MCRPKHVRGRRNGYRPFRFSWTSLPKRVYSIRRYYSPTVFSKSGPQPTRDVCIGRLTPCRGLDSGRPAIRVFVRRGRFSFVLARGLRTRFVSKRKHRDDALIIDYYSFSTNTFGRVYILVFRYH